MQMQQQTVLLCKFAQLTISVSINELTNLRSTGKYQFTTSLKLIRPESLKLWHAKFYHMYVR